LLRSRAHSEILGQIQPAHRAAAIDEELRRPRDVLTVLARPFVEQVVALDRDRVGIAEERERVVRFVAEIRGDGRLIDADRDRTDARCFERLQVFFDTP